MYRYSAICLQFSTLVYFFRKAADRITEYYKGLMSANCKPLTMGGDHFVTYPILRAIADKHGPVKSSISPIT